MDKQHFTIQLDSSSAGPIVSVDSEELSHLLADGLVRIVPYPPTTVSPFRREQPKQQILKFLAERPWDAPQAADPDDDPVGALEGPGRVPPVRS